MEEIKKSVPFNDNAVNELRKYNKLETLTGVVRAFVDFGNICSFAHFSYLPPQRINDE